MRPFSKAQRAASYTACAKDVRAALTLARQRACLGGRKTYVIFTNETDFAVVQPIGKVTKAADKEFFDAYADLSTDDTATGLLYNLNPGTRDNRLIHARMSVPDEDDWGEMNESGEIVLYKKQPRIRATCYDKHLTAYSEADWQQLSGHQKSHGWRTGDAYGTIISPWMRVPKGFEASFEGGDTFGSTHYAVFNPDGSADKKMTIAVKETIKKNSAANQVKVVIEKSGKISVD